MNKKIYRTTLYLIMVVGLLSGSCSKDEPGDSMAPTAVFTSPLTETVYQRGQSIIVNASFEDDKELSHVEVSIEEAQVLKGWNTPWETSEVIELSGKSQNLSAYELFGEAIPMDIKSGVYNLEFMVVDKQFNFANYNMVLTIE
ncbi:DUF4625 domain-containing protein [Carboxylicivirga mesophila]|uniref:DUF4625 domain-containing protein n=1 Tax=Carboxylicivirga mesophila TaxID=1166478 RepID=A0ABS5K6M7_9BACT|nr:DUF4625 domain-containing protein [Carboxylicivirga mesophila]MBS2210166.1 DUF4625 domain-containing protein [Carboxylicivirga mesophila]